MAKQEIRYEDLGGLRADQVQILVEKVAPQYFKGDTHQREVEASRIVFSFLVKNGPFELVDDAYSRLVSGWGSGKSHVSGYGDSGELQIGVITGQRLSRRRGNKGSGFKPFDRVR